MDGDTVLELAALVGLPIAREEAAEVAVRLAGLLGELALLEEHDFGEAVAGGEP